VKTYSRVFGVVVPNRSRLRHPYGTNAIEYWLEALDNPEVVTEAFNLVNVRSRTILPRQDLITVELYEDGPSDHVRGRMKSHGWTICTAENVEEDDNNLSDYNGYSVYDDYGYSDDDGHAEYDIDGDHDDFWRRAGDSVFNTARGAVERLLFHKVDLVKKVSPFC